MLRSSVIALEIDEYLVDGSQRGLFPVFYDFWWQFDSFKAGLLLRGNIESRFVLAGAISLLVKAYLFCISIAIHSWVWLPFALMVQFPWERETQFPWKRETFMNLALHAKPHWNDSAVDLCCIYITYWCSDFTEYHRNLKQISDWQAMKEF